MSKKKRLLEIIQDIQELYPHLDRLLVSDVDHPDQIVITSEEHIEQVARDEGFDIEVIETYFEDDMEAELEEEEMLKIIFDGIDDDDDNGGGMLQ